eukprot:SAG11_NODE_214_length_12237_cov_15.921486_4_plen_128_part_00
MLLSYRVQAICTYCARKPCGGLTEIRLTNYDTPTVDIFQEEFANIDQIAAAEAAASAAANEAAAAGAVGQELARVPVVVDRKVRRWWQTVLAWIDYGFYLIMGYVSFLEYLLLFAPMMCAVCFCRPN